MITDTLAQCRRYTSLHPHFAAAFDFIAQAPATHPDGRYEIDGENCFALIQTYQNKTMAQARFEAHREHIDIQFIQAGCENILWAPLASLTEVTQPYVAAKDVTFYAAPPQWTPIHLSAGQFSIFFPEDAHAPGIAAAVAGEVRKIVIKIRG